MFRIINFPFLVYHIDRLYTISKRDAISNGIHGHIVPHLTLFVMTNGIEYNRA